MEIFPSTPECAGLWRLWVQAPARLPAALAASQEMVMGPAARAEWYLLQAVASSGAERLAAITRARGYAMGSDHWRADLAGLLLLAGDALERADQDGFQLWAGRAFGAWGRAGQSDPGPRSTPRMRGETLDDLVLGGLSLSYYSISASFLSAPLVSAEDARGAARASALALGREVGYLGVRFGPAICQRNEQLVASLAI
jgi:hypothetical protein